MLPGGLCMSDMKNKMKTTLQKQKYTHKLFFYRFYTTMKTSVNVFFFLLLFTLKKMWEIQKCEKINKMWYVSLPFWQKKKSNLIALKLTHWRKNMINSTSLVGYTWINKWLLLFILSYSNVGKKKMQAGISRPKHPDATELKAHQPEVTRRLKPSLNGA